MRRRPSRLLALLVCAIGACSAPSPVVVAESIDRAPPRTMLQFDDIQSAEVDDWRPTGQGQVTRRWNVPLTKADIDEWRHLVAKGKRFDSPTLLFITAEYGVLYTALGDYQFEFGESKTAGNTFRLACRPIRPPAGRSVPHIQWGASDGRELMAALRRKLVTRAAEAKRASYKARAQ